ncbi:MAG TPA: CBS domain-containing protein [Nitrospira sp.]|jgi:CBS domain-containing protein|nr:CBS domain-containing protein [Nitrospira sp.]
MVRVTNLMTPQAEVISPDATAEDAASVMKTLDIGVLPVCDEEGLVGILTDRDLVVRVLAAKRDPKAMLVGEAMTPSVVYCFEDDDVERAALVMAGQQIRRLPVLDRNRKLVGIISIGDIAAQGQSQLGGEVLEEVSQPTGPKRADTPPDHDGGLGQAA